MTRWRRVTAGLVHRIVYATLLAAFVWYLAVVPYSMTPVPHSIHHGLLMALDAPLALVSPHLPWQLKTVDAWSSERQPEHANEWEYLDVHMRTAVPLYVIFFYLPNIVVWSVRRLRQRGTKEPYAENHPVSDRNP